ncbi:MAG: hypothetical protein H0T46_07255 [Deltaproteobacteria bacterium]|nr:hypothetical protein [Deltaproteobacteria bacterium]
MTRATLELRTAAERLLELESSAGKRAGRLPAARRVTDRLRQVLSTFLGAGGYRALLARALNLAKSEAPELSAVHLLPDGAIEGLSSDDGNRKRRFTDGEVVLVAHLLGLLVTFVGEALMLRLVHDTWPRVSLSDLDFDEGTIP